MTVGVVDVGSNTVRLVVRGQGRTIVSTREMLRLGADIEQHGEIPAPKLVLVAEVVHRFAETARAAGATELEVLVASPGRQASNGPELVDVLAAAARCPTRILSAAEEGRLAFLGAVSATLVPPRRVVAVVDVGGGSSQIVVGTHHDGPQWSHSIDIGSQRLTTRLLRGDPPGEAALAAARDDVRSRLADLQPPPCRTALAVGGSARAVKRLVGGRLDALSLSDALELLACTPTTEIADRYGIDLDRLPTVTAGATILASFQEKLATPLKVVRAGLRDGALAELAERRAAA